MIQRLKWICAALLVLVLVVAVLPADTLALKLPEMIGREGTLTYINPLYADVITEEDLRRPGTQDSHAQATPVACNSYEDILTAVRAAMVARVEDIAVTYPTSLSVDFNKLETDLFLHTGVPTEGDSLRYQFGGYNGSYGGGSLNLTVTYYTTAAQEQELNTWVEDWLTKSGLRTVTDYEKVAGVYDWLCDNVVYDYDNLNDASHRLKYTAYAAAIDKTSVCQGYAVLMYRLLLELDVDCRVVAGIGNGGPHAWNIVGLGGRYYNADATWDASYVPLGMDYEYFLRCDANFDDHTPDEDYASAEFTAAYPKAAEDYTASGIVASGISGDVNWVLDTEGTLTISGQGAMESYFSYVNRDWLAHRDAVKAVTIGDGVTNIGQYAFFGCSLLERVTIGNGVTFIGPQAFSGCTGLTEITIPDSVKSIWKDAFAGCVDLIQTENGVSYVDRWIIGASGEIGALRSNTVGIVNEAFYGCTELKSLSIPDSVRKIGVRAFYGCTGLTDVTVGNKVAGIEEQTFYGCSNLVNVTLGNGVAAIGRSAFRGCSRLTGISLGTGLLSVGEKAFYGCGALTEITIPDSVTTIGEDAFYDCVSLSKAVLGDGLVSIGDSAFYHCDSLTEIVIPDGVTAIGHNTFMGCNSLTTVTLGSGVTGIGSMAFDSCENLASINIPAGVTDIGSRAFRACGRLQTVNITDMDAWCRIRFGGEYSNPLEHWSATLYLNGKEPTEVVIPDGVTQISNYLFAHFPMTSVTIPASVTYIESNAFYACRSLREVHISDMDAWCRIRFEGSNSSPLAQGDVCLYLNGELPTAVVIPQDVTCIAAYHFKNCSALTSITIPASVTHIGEGAFYNCSSLTGVTIPASVTHIGEGAFNSCSSLTGVSLSRGLLSIGAGAFRECVSLTDITVPDSVTSIGSVAFSNCRSLTGIVLPEGVTIVEDGLFDSCSSLESITLGSGVTRIGSWAFEQCTALKAIELPDSLLTIGDRAFYFCRNLMSITVPDGVTGIASDTFNYCENLTSAVLGNGVTEIGQNAFNFCINLTSIHIPDSVISIGTGAFKDCRSLTAITIPAGVTCIEDSTFESCYSLTGIVIPDSVVSIGAYAFSSCGSMVEVTVGDGVTSIGEYAFSGSGLRKIVIPGKVSFIGGTTFFACRNLEDVVFTGDVPTFDGYPFSSTTVNAYYPGSNATWTADVLLGYGGTLTWLPYELDAEGHGAASVPAVAPTCTESGWTEGIRCLLCDAILVAREEIPATGHNYQAVVIAPTCINEGYTIHRCANCTDSYVDSYVAMTDHIYNEWVETGTPTCTEAGYERSICAYCENICGREIAPLGHDYQAAVTAPTCTEQGYTTHTCSRCYGSYADSWVDATGHTYGEWTVSIAPGCTNSGEEIRHCHCGQWESRTTSSLGHDYQAAVTAPTCTEQGYTTHTCSRCGHSYTDEYVPATGHSYGQWMTLTAPTCTEKGQETRTCHCGETETREIAALGHDYKAVVTAPTCTEDGYTAYTCRCGDSYVADWVPALGHDYYTEVTSPTCTEQGYTVYTCARCGHSYQDDYIPALGHSTVQQNQTDATCTENGYTGDWICARCGTVTEYGTVIPALGHSWGSWITVTEPTEEAEGEAERVCTVCGMKETKMLPKLDHVHEHTAVVTAPTCTEDGYTTYICRCGDSYVTDRIPALGHNEVIVPGKGATCTEPGITDGRQCGRCGEILVQQEEIPASGHFWTEYEEVRPAGCTETGLLLRHCVHCGQEDSVETLPVGHREGERVKIEEVAATCETDGYRIYVAHCTGCGMELSRGTEILFATGHAWSEWIVTQEPTEEAEGWRKRTCANCGREETQMLPPLEHTHSYTAVVTAPSCTEDGYTAYTCHCGDSYVADIVPALGHLEVTDPGRYATCTAPGLTEGTHCDRCGEILVPQTEIPATGHIYGNWTQTKAPTCTEKGQEQSMCKNCDHYETRDVAALGHSHTSAVTDPTCTERGYTTHTCHCGDSYVDSYTEPLGHTDGAVCGRCGEMLAVWGDVSGDRNVTVQDAILVLRYVAKLVDGSALDLAMADVNGDGNVTVQDAILILRYVAKLITQFPVQK